MRRLRYERQIRHSRVVTRLFKTESCERLSNFQITYIRVTLRQNSLAFPNSGLSLESRMLGKMNYSIRYRLNTSACQNVKLLSR